MKSLTYQIDCASGYNTAHAIKALPLFMPSEEQARVRIMVFHVGRYEERSWLMSTGHMVWSE